MIFYQLAASGKMAIFPGSGQRTIHSKRIFKTTKEAEDYQPEFVLKCTTPQGETDLTYLESISKIGILPLELED